MKILFIEDRDQLYDLIKQYNWRKTIKNNFRFLAKDYNGERGHVYYIVIEENRLVAGIALEPFHDPRLGKELWLKYVDVNTAFKQRGIATILVRKAFEYAQQYNLAIRGSSRTEEGAKAMPKIMDRSQNEFPKVRYIPSKETRLARMQDFVLEQLSSVSRNDPILERFLQMENDMGKTIRVAENPGPLELKSLIEEGRGLRILVGADEFSNVVLVWAGTGEGEDIGAIHDTIGDQYGMTLYGNRHVPMEMSPKGRLKVTVTVQETALEDQREVEDVLDRNRKFQRMFGSKEISYAALRSLV